MRISNPIIQSTNLCLHDVNVSFVGISLHFCIIDINWLSLSNISQFSISKSCKMWYKIKAAKLFYWNLEKKQVNIVRRNSPMIYPITLCLCDVNISPLRMLLHLEIDIQHQNKSNNFGRRIRSLSHRLDKCQNSRWQRQDPCRIDPALWRHLFSLQSIPCSRSRRLPDHTRCQRGIAFRERKKKESRKNSERLDKIGIPIPACQKQDFCDLENRFCLIIFF